MKNSLIRKVFLTTKVFSSPNGQSATVLTEKERAEGWEFIFTGTKGMGHELGSDGWKTIWEAGGGIEVPTYRADETGPIGLYDHEGRFSYRNIKTKKL